MKPERLSPLDSSYLSMDGPVTVGHVCILCPLDGPVTLAQLRERVEQRIHRVPAMRRHLQTTLIGLGRPWWVDDPDFDLNQHLFEVTLSGEGDDLELSKHVARIATGRLNRAHPLWEIHLVQGRRGGSSALVTKIHHAVMDGIAARDLLYDLFGDEDDVPEQDAAAGWTPGPWPSELELVINSIKDTQGWLGTVARFEYRATAGLVDGAERAVSGLVGGIAGGLGGLVGGIAGGLGAITGGLGGLAGDRAGKAIGSGSERTEQPDDPVAEATVAEATVAHATVADREPQRARSASTAVVPVPNKPDRSWWSVAPDSIINGPVTAARSYGFGSRGLADSRAARHATATTINDIVIAATAGGLRAWLLEAAALPEEPLIAMIPIGGRTAPGREDVGGNRLALTLCTVPTHLADPIERLYAAHDAMVRAKTTPSLGESLLEDLTRVTAPGLTNLTVEAFYRLHLATRVRFPYNLIITNVPGSPLPLGLGQSRFTGLHPCPPLSDTMGLNIAAHGYRDRLCFGVSACPDMVPDVAHLVALIVKAHDELVAAVEAATELADPDSEATSAAPIPASEPAATAPPSPVSDPASAPVSAPASAPAPEERQPDEDTAKPRVRRARRPGSQPVGPRSASVTPRASRTGSAGRTGSGSG